MKLPNFFSKRFKFHYQLEQMDCGPTCLRMVSRYYGKKLSLSYLREICHTTRAGVSLLGIKKGAETLGLKTLAIKVKFEDLIEKVPHPCILHWRQNHFVVLVKAKKQRSLFGESKDVVVIADPGFGTITLDKERLLNSWETNEKGEGVALVVLPSETFENLELTEEQKSDKTRGLLALFDYLKPYKKYVFQLFLGMFLGGLLNLSIPILTQKLIDTGIQDQNIDFIYLILMSQLAIFLGSMVLEVLRGWILLHMNTRVNVSIISDFLIKLMRLPIRFFDNRLMADITQRVDDHDRIETFLTSSSLNTFFSLVNFGVFSFILCYYSPAIFGTFVLGSLLAIGWILTFMKKRKGIDYSRFELSSENRNSMYEIINGMQEIKLNTCETSKRWEWENVQAKLFKLNQRSLALSQTQEMGVDFFNQLKNIFITFIAAYFVVQGEITLGMMLSISYIIGQMNGPIEQLQYFFLEAQDAKISLERLGEIHRKKDEVQETDENKRAIRPSLRFNERDNVAFDNTFNGIEIKNLSFKYEGINANWVLQDLDLFIPKGKITAIVGTSGSGKTTLIKLLLKFYNPQSGCVITNGADLSTISPNYWRSHCGVVMQQGYIFSDTIGQNIALTNDEIDKVRLIHAAKMANIYDYINSLPLGFDTKIGEAGAGLSGGQEQRILIARAIYKNPPILFFDEATSALDANNERIIMDNLNRFFEGKTVVVIAHRLSTVKNADQIVVLEDGKVIERGNHETLTMTRGQYYNLVKNQLELGV